MRAAKAATFVMVSGMLLAQVGAEAARPQSAAREPWLVSTAWLQEHLADPDLVVLHVVATRREYRQGHIPGARFLWSQSYAPSTPDGTYELPTFEQAAALATELGPAARLADRPRVCRLAGSADGARC